MWDVSDSAIIPVGKPWGDLVIIPVGEPWGDLFSTYQISDPIHNSLNLMKREKNKEPRNCPEDPFVIVPKETRYNYVN